MKRGFANMDPNRVKAIASKGGKSAHAKGTAYKFDPAKASEYGRQGGLATSKDRAHMAEIGRKGAKVRNEGDCTPSNE